MAQAYPRLATTERLRISWRGVWPHTSSFGGGGELCVARLANDSWGAFSPQAIMWRMIDHDRRCGIHKIGRGWLMSG